MEAVEARAIWRWRCTASDKGVAVALQRVGQKVPQVEATMRGRMRKIMQLPREPEADGKCATENTHAIRSIEGLLHAAGLIHLWQ